MKKKIFAIALALYMVLTMMPSMGFAEEESAQRLYVLYAGDADENGQCTTSQWENAVYIKIGASRTPKYFGVITEEPDEMTGGNEYSFEIVAVGNYNDGRITIAEQEDDTYRVTVADGTKLTGAEDAPYQAYITANGKQYFLDYCVEAASGGGDDSGNWKPDTGYERTPVVEFQEDVIPCETLPASRQYESYYNLIASGCLLGGPSDPYKPNPDPSDTNLTKNINLSLAPGAEGNTFYVLHPENTELTQESYQQFLYTEDGGHEYITGPVRDGNTEVSRSRGSKKIAENIYKIEPVMEDGEIFKVTYTVDENESFTLIASKIILSGDKYHGHNNIYSKFTAIPKNTVEEENKNNEETPYAVVCLAKGMNITISGNPNGAAYINGDLEFSEWAMDLEPSSKLVWKDVDNKTKSAFYENACAHITEGGQGRILELCLELKPGYILEKITDSTGDKIDYVAEHFQYLLLKDETGKEIIGKRFWDLLDNLQEDLYEKYNLSPAANGDPEAEDSPAFLEAYHCFAAEKTYASADIKENIGSENISSTIKFLNDYKYSVEQKNEYTNYKLYFNKEKDNDITGITFHIKKAESTGTDISSKNNGDEKNLQVSDAAATTDTKNLLKQNLAAIGTDGYEVKDVYNMTSGDSNVTGLYNITIPAEKLTGADPKECKVVYYADDNAIPLEMETTYTTDAEGNANGIVFTTGHFSNYAVLYKSKTNPKPSGGGAIAPVPSDVTTSGAAGDKVTTAKADVEVTEQTNADGTKMKIADVKVSTDNQKEILKQAKANKSKEIILDVSKDAVKDAAKAEVTLDKSFIDSIVKDTDAKLTIKTPLGDKTYTQEELKAMSEAATGSDITVAIEEAAEPTAEEIKAEKIAKAKSGVEKADAKARSSKLKSGSIKIVFNPDAKAKAFIEEMEAQGFTVKYRFYRSTKKSSGYKAMVTKETKSCINKTGKKGMKYFYKVQVRVYDENGKLVAKTALKQCKYASRTWSK